MSRRSGVYQEYIPSNGSRIVLLTSQSQVTIRKASKLHYNLIKTLFKHFNAPSASSCLRMGIRLFFSGKLPVCGPVILFLIGVYCWVTFDREKGKGSVLSVIARVVLWVWLRWRIENMGWELGGRERDCINIAPMNHIVMSQINSITIDIYIFI